MVFLTQFFGLLIYLISQFVMFIVFGMKSLLLRGKPSTYHVLKVLTDIHFPELFVEAFQKL